MAVSKAQQQATNRYISKSYDRINLTVQKGQKEDLQAHAAARGESTNAFINRAITNQIERDNGGEAAAAAMPQAGAAGGLEIAPDLLEVIQGASEAAGEAPGEFLARAVKTQAERDTVARRINLKGGGL